MVETAPRLKNASGAGNSRRHSPAPLPTPLVEDGEFGGARKSTAPPAVQAVRRLFTEKRMKTMTASTKSAAEPESGSQSARGERSKSSHTNKSSHEPKPQKHKPESKPSQLRRGLSNVYSAIVGGDSSSSKKQQQQQHHHHQHTTKPAEPAVQRKASKAEPAAPVAAIRFMEPNIYFIENYVDTVEPIKFGDEENAGMRHGVMVQNCSNCVIQISKKVNKIELDACKKVTLILPAVLSSIDIGRSQSCTIQVTSRCPGLNIDNSTSINVYIPRDSMDVIEIASSGGGSANVMIPTEEDATEYKEYPIPFQFVHNFKENRLVSEASPLYFH